MLIDNKKINIYWRRSPSAYAKANKKVIVELNRKIGSSTSAVGKMIANGDEMKVLMPEILNLSVTSPHWDAVLKNYWDSISEAIPGSGKELEIGFKYDVTVLRIKEYVADLNKGLKDEKKIRTDKDLKTYFDNKVIEIDKEYSEQLKNAAVLDERDKDTLERTAYDAKYTRLIDAESIHYRLGSPISVADYLLYRHCLVYRGVANDAKYMNKSSYIRFYLYSKEEIERDKRIKYDLERKAMKLYSAIVADKDRVEDVLFILGKGTEVMNAVDETDKQMMLLEQYKSEPGKFLEVASDKNLEKKGLIEKLIVNNVLRRLDNTEVIVESVDASKVIGNNMNDAIAYFANSTNKAVVSELISKYKGLPKK